MPLFGSEEERAIRERVRIEVSERRRIKENELLRNIAIVGVVLVLAVLFGHG